MPKKHNAYGVFIHGLANKPAAERLYEIWRQALDRDDPKPEVFGYGNYGLGWTDKNIGSRLTYYADVFYAQPDPDESGYESAQPHAFEGVERSHPAQDSVALPTPRTEAQRRFLSRLSTRFGLDANLPDEQEPPAAAVEQVEAGAVTLERVPLPLGVKKAIVKKFAMEAFYYLFDEPFTPGHGRSPVNVRKALQDRLIADIQAASELSDRVAVISHSMGTIVAYDCLRNRADCPPVYGLMTLGSPLGVDEVQDGLIPADRDCVDYPSGKVLGRWVNVFDRLDPIAADPWLATDFRQQGRSVIQDINEQNWGEWRHTITHYLQGPKLRAALRSLLAV